MHDYVNYFKYLKQVKIHEFICILENILHLVMRSLNRILTLPESESRKVMVSESPD